MAGRIPVSVHITGQSAYVAKCIVKCVIRLLLFITVSVGLSIELLRYQSPILMTLKSELVVDPVSPVDVAQTEQNDVAMV